ncbi:MAG: hypothetical protein EG825_08975 [Rhodocyclaceae bacterium]|nr:hypothetical protein [Rhodocyclaceae bacterium]
MRLGIAAATSALILVAGSAMAQPSEAQKAEWRAKREAMGGEGPSEEQIAKWRAQRAAGGGDANAARPPEGASMEEKRAFYQKRAAERAQAEAAAAAATPASAPAVAGKPAATDHRGHGGGEKSDAKPSAPGAVTAMPGKPGETAAGGGRPGGMGGMGGMPAGMMRGAGGVLWLSDTPPMRGEGGGRPGGMGGMSGMAMGGERSGPPTRRLWLRSGNDPQKSGFAREDAESPPEYVLVSPAKAEGEPLPPATESRKGLVFETPVQGFYRLYVTTRKLQGETLSVNVAKAEVPYFSHGGDEEERAAALKVSRYLESAPIEIVRERAADEKPFFQLKSGDDQAFIVLQRGLPLQGARVRFISHQGWTKEAVSDEQGRVSFQVLRDYFPPWEDFQKRFKATYLLIAEASAAESGRYKDQPYSAVRYQTTLSGAYYPASADYRSYAWGLGIGLVIVLFSGTAIYLYRRRRVKPFQEVRLDEKS